MEIAHHQRVGGIFHVPRVQLPDWFVFACLSVPAGLLDAFLIFGWHDINPANLDWLRGDPTIYQAGWEFLRRSSWTFPPTWIARLDFPFGISAAYLDVIPVLALPLRLVSGLLPADFQYLGAYAALCLILQAYFGLKLVSRFTSDRLFIFIGALFFLNAPILVSRLTGHFSLCSHWLILAALDLYYARVGAARAVRHALPFAVLLVLAGGITPYLAVMVFAISVAALFRWHLMNRIEAVPGHDERFPHASDHHDRARFARVLAIPSVQALLGLAILFSVMLAAFVFFGFMIFSAPAQLSGEGYTEYSMNLLGPINPVTNALYFRQFDVLPNQIFEGYNYLGMGVILLGTICLARRPDMLAIIWGPSSRAIVVCVILLTVLALSAKVTLGQTTLFVIPLPQSVLHGLAVFRSSGRFFWPAHYLIVLGVVAATLVAFGTRRSRCTVLAAALLLQYFDILPVRDAVAERSEARYTNPLHAAAWLSAARSHKHLIVLPAWQCDPDHTPGGDENWIYFATLAARNGMTLNSTPSARKSAPSDAYNCSWLPQHVALGWLAPDTSYVLSDTLAISAITHETTHYCRRVDGLNLCTFNPRMAYLSYHLGQMILPPLMPGTVFRAERAVPKGLLMDGWELRPYPAIWTVGRHASIYFRPALRDARNLLLEFRLGGYGALLTPSHPLQRAIISVNGERIGTLRFTYGGDNLQRTIVIPGRLLHDGRVTEIRMDLPDAAAPRDLGINADGRLLGLYVSRFRIITDPSS